MCDVPYVLFFHFSTLWLYQKERIIYYNKLHFLILYSVSLVCSLRGRLSSLFKCRVFGGAGKVGMGCVET